jgi:hypothetical protein
MPFRDISVTAFLLALSEFARYPHSAYRINPPPWDEIAGEAQRESKKRGEFRSSARSRAGSAYANMHTTRFPGGEIRGQVAVHRGDVDDDEN